MATGSIGLNLEQLRKLLLQLRATGEKGFEGLLAVALSEFSGLTIRLAKSGSQFGKDGRSPSASFAIAMEAKRYAHDPGMEVLAKAAVAGGVLSDSVDLWAVGATSAIGDDTLERITALLEDRGVTFLALDWAPCPLPRMAVLLTATRGVSVKWLSDVAGQDEAALNGVVDAIAADSSYDAEVVKLRDEVTAAKVGLDALRKRNEAWLSMRFQDPPSSQLAFGQYLTIAAPNWPAVSRPVFVDHLTKEAAFAPPSERPVVVSVLGEEGVGKTWLVAQWWASLKERPIMVMVSGRRVERVPPHDPLQGLAYLLSEQVPCISHDPSGGWLRRLLRWKTQCWTGQLRFIIALDGLNEQPTRPWADLIKGLANEAHALGGLVIVTSRTRYWHESVRPKLPDYLDLRTVPVSEFDDDEVKAALDRVSVPLSSLPERVRDFVRNPRICALAIKLLDRLILQPGQLTVDRLLFEYWRYRLDERGDLVSHGIADFEKLIRSHARAWMKAPSRGFERDDWLSHSGAGRRLGPGHVVNDISDIEEGRFLQISDANAESYEFKPEALPYALALLVNSELRDSGSGEHPREHLARILDPIRGFDFVAAVIAAAVRLACLESKFPEETRAALVKAWMGSQNVDYDEAGEMSAYVRACPDAFLRAAELSGDTTQPFVHRDLLLALVMPVRDVPSVQKAISQRSAKWLVRWSRQLRPSFNPDIDSRRQATRETHIASVFASMTADEIALLRSVTFEEADASPAALDTVATIFLAGRPLEPHAPGILGWAFARVIAPDEPGASSALAWIVRLNPIDAQETEAAVRLLVKGIDIGSSEPVRNAAARALRLLGTRDSAQVAEVIDPSTDGVTWRRVATFCNTKPHDPSAPAGSNLDNAREAARAIDPLTIWSTRNQSMQDSDLEGIIAALARFDPTHIIPLLRSIVGTADERTGGALQSLSWRLVDVSPLFDDATVRLVRSAYQQLLIRPDPDVPDYHQVLHSFARSLMPHLPAEGQLDILLALPLEFPLSLTLQDSVRPLPASVLEKRLEAVMAASNVRELRWILFFAAGSKVELTQRSRQLIAWCLTHSDPSVRACASECVYQAQDRALDELMLRSERVGGASDIEFLERYRDAAEARAIVVGRREDLVHRVAPRLLGYVAHELGGQALALLADSVDRILASLLGHVDVEAPADIEISVEISREPLPGRYHVKDGNDDTPSKDFRRFVDEVNHPELAARRLSERHRVMNEKAAAYLGEISTRNAREIGEEPPHEGLRELALRGADRVAGWLQRILAVQDPRVLRQVCNLAVCLAQAYSIQDPAISAKVFEHFRECESILNVQVGPEQMPLYQYALFSSGGSDALADLKRGIFERASNDSELQMATVAADACGADSWLDEYVQDLLESWHPANQARGLTILGFRQPNAISEQVLSGTAEHGFLSDVKQFARENYTRATWTRHWLDCIASTNDRSDFWRYGKLAEAICDLRFFKFFPTVVASEMLDLFGTDLYQRMHGEAGKRSEKLRETLFGLKAPERELLSAVRHCLTGGYG